MSNYPFYLRIDAIQSRIKSNNSILVKIRAEQPTMTTQKIQALMTGSEVYSVTGIFDAFFSTSVAVDNIISQIHRHNGSSVSLGDNTWNKLFEFTVSYPCESTFDIWDWSTCDTIIYNNLIHEIKRSPKHWFNVAHFLSLDHIGHSTSSLTHPEFKTKKQMISDFIQKIIIEMDGNTVLMVTGDHGMRDDGNHGGNSKEQVQTFLFSFSKNNRIHSLLEQSSGSVDGDIQIYRQPDITATLSLLLNIPVPVNSVGIPIFLTQNCLGKQQQRQQISQPTQQRAFKQRQLLKRICQNLVNHFERQSKSHIQLYTNTNTSASQSNQCISFLKQYQKGYINSVFQNDKDNINFLQAGITMLVMSVICLSFAYFLQSKIVQYVIVILVAVPHSFSWLIVRNSSSYYFLSFVFVVLLDSSITSKRKAITILLMMVMCQLQPVKNGEYSVNLIRFQSLATLMTNKHIQTLIIAAYIVRALRKISERTTLYQNQNQNQNQRIIKNQSQNKYHFTMLSNAINMSFVVIVSLSCILKNYEYIQLQVSFNLLMVVITVLFITVIAIVYAKNKQQFADSMASYCRQITNDIIGYWSIIFLGAYPIPTYLILFFILTLTKTNYPTLNGYIRYTTAHLVWWLQGNRYEYSSIDIKQSYIFSSSYHSLLNPICMILVMICPYLISYFPFTGQHLQSSQYISPNEEESYSLSGKESWQSKAVIHNKQPLPKNSRFDVSNLNLKNQFHNQRIKYLLMPMCWLICCCLNVVLNNGKILYTVVYVPMLVIQLLKTFIFIMVTIVSFVLN